MLCLFPVVAELFAFLKDGCPSYFFVGRMDKVQAVGFRYSDLDLDLVASPECGVELEIGVKMEGVVVPLVTVDGLLGIFDSLCVGISVGLPFDGKAGNGV